MTKRFSLLAGLATLGTLGLGLLVGSPLSERSTAPDGAFVWIAQALAQSAAPPLADAGADGTAAVGATVVLDGSGSSHPNGDELTLSWAFVSVPAGSAAVLSA